MEEEELVVVEVHVSAAETEVKAKNIKQETALGQRRLSIVAIAAIAVIVHDGRMPV